LDEYETQFKNKIEKSINDLIEVLDKLKNSKIHDIKSYKLLQEMKFQKIKRQYFDIKYKYANFSKKNDFILNLITRNTFNTNKKPIDKKSSIDSSVSFCNHSFQIKNNNELNNYSFLNKSNISGAKNHFSLRDNSLIDIIKLINLDLNNNIEIIEDNFEKYLKAQKESFLNQTIHLDQIFLDFKNQISLIIDKQISNEVETVEIPSFDKPLLARIKKYSVIFEELNQNFLIKNSGNFKNIEKKISEMESKFYIKEIRRKDSINLNYPNENNIFELNNNEIDLIENMNFNRDNIIEEDIYGDKLAQNGGFINNIRKISNNKKNSWNDLLKSHALSKIELLDKTQFDSPSKKIDFSRVSLSDFNLIESIKVSNSKKTSNGLLGENLNKKGQGFNNINKNKWNKNYILNQKISDIIKSDSKENENIITINTNTKNIKISDNPIKLQNSLNFEFENNYTKEENEIVDNLEKEEEINLGKKIIIKSKSSNIINKKKSPLKQVNDSNNSSKPNKSNAFKNWRNKSHTSTSSFGFKNHESDLKLNFTNMSNKMNNSVISNSIILSRRKNLMKKYIVLTLLETLDNMENQEKMRNKNETLKHIKEYSIEDCEDNSFSNFINDYNNDAIVVKIITGSDELIVYDKIKSEIKKHKINISKKVHSFDKFLHGSRTLVLDSKIYIAGGKDEKSTFSSFIEYDYKSYELNLLDDMLSPRSYFNFFYIPNLKRIFCIGGEKNKSCEYYDLYAKKWFKLPDLKYPRAYMSCFLNEKETNNPKSIIQPKEKRLNLYTLFGIKSEISKGEFTDIIEVLELDKDGDPIEFTWKKVEFDNRSDVDLRNSYVKIMPIDQDKLIVIGNCLSRYNQKSFAYYDIFKAIINKLNTPMIYNIKKRSEKSIIYKKLLSDINMTLNNNSSK